MKNIKKTHKKTPKNLTYTNHLIKFGTCGLKILSDLSITKEQLTSIERFLHKKLKDLSNSSKRQKMWCFIQFNKTLSKLSLESRMGKGKGPIYTEVVFLKKGSILYEFHNIKNQQIKEIFKFIKKHFSVELKLIYKN